MDFSVVVPVLNEEKRLARCLEALTKLDYPKDEYEIIVVDNGSTDTSIDIAKSYRVRVVHEPKQGITYARQKGLEVAKGKYYITTDADAIPPRDWLLNAKRVFNRSNEIVAITGPSYGYDANPLFNKLMGWAGAALVFIPKDKAVLGGNMAFRTDKLKEVGGFTYKNYKFYEDAIVSIRMPSVGKIAVDMAFVNTVSTRRYRGLRMVNILRNILNYFTIKYAGLIAIDDLRHLS